MVDTHVTDRRGVVEVERSPRMREIGIRSPVATDPLVKQVMTAVLPRARQQLLYLQFT